MTVACPHFDVSIRQRSKGQSAVAGAAYMSAEKLFSEYDQRTKNFCYKKKKSWRRASCCLPTRHGNLQTDRRSGMLWKHPKSNGTRSLHGVSLWRCQESYLLINMKPSSANTAWNNSCPGA